MIMGNFVDPLWENGATLRAARLSRQGTVLRRQQNETLRYPSALLQGDPVSAPGSPASREGPAVPEMQGLEHAGEQGKES